MIGNEYLGAAVVSYHMAEYVHMDAFYMVKRPKSDSCIPGKMSTNEFSDAPVVSYHLLEYIVHVNAFYMVFDPQTDASIAIKK